jgi:hypothetical protein
VELAAAARAAGAPAAALTARQYYAIQLLAIRREQGRMGEIEDAARQMVAANQSRPAWRAALATVLWESGKLDDAGAELERLAQEGFRDIPRDGDWITTMALIADLCAALGDRKRSAIVYEMLLPYAAVNAVVGIAVICIGSVARLLGRLAAVGGARAHAAGHFERALDAHTQLRAPVLLAHAQLDCAEALGSGPRRGRLIDEATHAAAELGLPAVARRAERLQRG